MKAVGPAVFSLAWVLLVLEGCSRVPPEPSNGARDVSVIPTGTGSVDADGGISTAGRCLVPTSVEPPPAVSAVPEARCPKDPEPDAAPLRTASISIDTPAGSVVVDAELALTNTETSKGLMYRRELPDTRAMFFSLGARRVQTFWMRNTCIPLDMMFVDQDGLIVGILENVPPMNDAERSVGCPTPYVVEFAAGFSRRHGVKAGQRMHLPPL